MAEYKTEQKKELTDFLTAHCEEAFTIEEVIEKMREGCEGDKLPGKSTVYRLMTRLVDDGRVKRFVKHGRCFVYQIVCGERCASHLHMRCTGCGRLIHLDEATSDELVEKIGTQSGFSISEEDTVLLGKCDGCRRVRIQSKTGEGN